MGKLFIFSTRWQGKDYLFQNEKVELDHPLLKDKFGGIHRYYYPLIRTDEYKVVAVKHLPKDRSYSPKLLNEWKEELKQAFYEDGRYDDITYILHDRDICLTIDPQPNWFYDDDGSERTFGFIHSNKEDFIAKFLCDLKNYELSSRPSDFVSKLERVLVKVAAIDLISNKWEACEFEHPDYIEKMHEFKFILDNERAMLKRIVVDQEHGNWSEFLEGLIDRIYERD